MDVSVDRSTDYGIGYHGGAPIRLRQPGQGVFYGGNNPVDLHQPGVPLEPRGASRSACAGPDIPNSQNLFGTGLSIPALGVVLQRDGAGRRQQRPRDAAHPRDRQPGRDDLHRAEHPAPDRTSAAASARSPAGSAARAGGALGGARRARRPRQLGGFSAPRQDIGTKITVTPHVNDSDQVRLELEEEISDAGAPQGALGAIPINKRTREDDARRPRSADRGHRRPRARRRTPTARPRSRSSATSRCSASSSSRRRRRRRRATCSSSSRRTSSATRTISAPSSSARCRSGRSSSIATSSSTRARPGRRRSDFRRANGLVEDIRQSMLAAGREGCGSRWRRSRRRSRSARAEAAHPAAADRRARRQRGGRRPAERRAAPSGRRRACAARAACRAGATSHAER